MYINPSGATESRLYPLNTSGPYLTKDDSASRLGGKPLYPDPALNDQTLLHRSSESRASEATSDSNFAQSEIRIKTNGFSLSEAARLADTENIPGGSELRVTDSVTVKNESGDELLLGSGDRARIFKSSGRKAVVQNRETGEEITLSAGDEFNVDGEGSMNLAGNVSSLHMPSGESFQLRSAEDGGLEIRRPSTEENVSVSEAGRPVEVSGGEMTFLDGGNSVSFEAGETGRIYRGDEQIHVENSSTGNQMSLAVDENISLVGDAEVTVGEKEEISFSGTGRIRFKKTGPEDDETLYMFKVSSAESAEIESLVSKSPEPESIHFDFSGNTDAARFKLLVDSLLNPGANQNSGYPGPTGSASQGNGNFINLLA